MDNNLIFTAMGASTNGLENSFIILTSLPSVVNIYNSNSLDWWVLPSSSSTMDKLIPAWWQGMYPITYYYIGCYLSEYKIKLRVRYQILILILVILVIR